MAIYLGHHNLMGVWREDGVEIPFGGGLGIFTLTANIGMWSANQLWEKEKEGYITFVGSHSSVYMVDAKLEMPGIFGEDVPAAVADIVLKSVADEIFNVYNRHLGIYYSAIEHLKKPFEVRLASIYPI